MGREIRRVPPNWEHPKTDRYEDDRFQPLFDEDYETAAARWLDGLLAWERGEDPDRTPDGDPAGGDREPPSPGEHPDITRTI